MKALAVAVLALMVTGSVMASPEITKEHCLDLKVAVKQIYSLKAEGESREDVLDAMTGRLTDVPGKLRYETFPMVQTALEQAYKTDARTSPESEAQAAFAKCSLMVKRHLF